MVIDITDASSINYSQPLNPKMLSKGGMLINSSQKELKFRLDKRYAMQKIKHEYAQQNVSINYEGDISFLNGHPIVEKIEDFGNTTGIRVKNANQTQELLKLLVDRNVTLKKFDANDISLHEIFIQLAGKPIEELTQEVSHV